MRRTLGAGIGILSLEFVGGSIAFLWPNVTGGLGATVRVGTMSEILAANPKFASGQPHDVDAARCFLINVPAARALASGQPLEVPQPDADQLIALWRKCPHLGCIVPDLCETAKRFECRCHGSTFNILGEKLEKGPAQRGMDRFAVLVGEDGTVSIDTREMVRGAPEGVVTFTDPLPPDAGCA